MMLKTLLKKQMMEIFRSYFYDSKKNRKRPRITTMVYICLYAVLMLGVDVYKRQRQSIPTESSSFPTRGVCCTYSIFAG